MKRGIVIFGIIAIFILLIFMLYLLFTVKIKIEHDTSEISSVRIYVAGQEAYTKSKTDIKQVISTISTTRLYKGKGLKIYSKDPDAYVSLFDENGNKIEDISFYGGVAIVNNSYEYKYGILPFTYKRLENLCRKINVE